MNFDKVNETGLGMREFPTGSVRDKRDGKGRYDLIPPYPMKRIAVHYENGAKKYGDRNWEKGQPLMSYLDSAERHLNNIKMGDISEDHESAVAWNMLGYMDTLRRIENGELSPELDDRPLSMMIKSLDKSIEDFETKLAEQIELEDECKVCDTLQVADFKGILDKVRTFADAIPYTLPSFSKVIEELDEEGEIRNIEDMIEGEDNLVKLRIYRGSFLSYYIAGVVRDDAPEWDFYFIHPQEGEERIKAGNVEGCSIDYFECPDPDDFDMAYLIVCSNGGKKNEYAVMMGDFVDGLSEEKKTELINEQKENVTKLLSSTFSTIRIHNLHWSKQ